MNQCAFKHLLRNLPLNDSMKALSVGLPGREKSSVTPRWYAHRSKSRDTNSEPWSTRMTAGNPTARPTLSSTSTTSAPRKLNRGFDSRREARERVDNRQHAQLRPGRQLVVHKVHCPGLVRSRRRSAVLPQLSFDAALGCL